MTDQELRQIRELRETINNIERDLREAKASLTELILIENNDTIRLNIGKCSHFTSKENGIKFQEMFIELINGDLSKLKKEFEAIEINFNK